MMITPFMGFGFMISERNISVRVGDMKQWVILAVIVILVIIGYGIYKRQSKEGFDLIGATTASETYSPLNAPNTSPVPFTGWTPPSGMVPSAAQSSSIPATTPDATVGNPTMSIAQATDLESTLDSINAFHQLFVNTQLELLDKDQAQLVREVHSECQTIQPTIMASYAKPASTTITVAQLSAVREKIANATSVLRSQPSIKEGFASPTPVGGSVDVITLPQLQNLVNRIKAALLVLSNLRSTDATLTQRSSHLEQLSADIQNMITKIQKGMMKLSDVPITPAAADAFLKQVDMTDIQLPDLVSSHDISGTPIEDISGGPVQTNAVGSAVNQLQAIFKTLQDVKFTVNVQLAHDPKTAQRTRVIDRIESLEKKMFAYASSDTPMPQNMIDAVKAELATLKAVLQDSTESHHSPADSLRPVQDKTQFSSPEFPSFDKMQSAAGDFAMSVVNNSMYSDPLAQFKPNTPAKKNKNWWDGGYASPDTFVRPGAPLTDEQIAHRGSTSAFDESTVGGLDYRARAKDVCRQLKEEHGNARDFGCIEDQDSVSSDYSWSGNFKMICNRVGDMWGSDEGAKYGCPPYNPNNKFRQS